MTGLVTPVGAGYPVNPAPAPFSYHVPRTLFFALPIIVARAAILVMFTIDTVMTGWTGGMELAYLGLGVAPQVTLMLVAVGALQAAVVLISQAIGAGRPKVAGDVLRIAVTHALLLGLAICGITLFAERFFLLTGQAEELAQGAAAVSLAFAYGTPGVLLFTSLSLFLECTGRPKVSMFVMLAANAANILLNGVFMLGWGGLFEPGGATDAILVSSCLRWLAALILGVYVFIRAGPGDVYGVLAEPRTWIRQIATFGGETGARLRRLGFPMGIAQGVESAGFSTVVFFAGLLGADALAAYQVTMALVALTFMMAIGMAGATSIRVGRAVGRANAANIRRAGWTGVGLGALFTIPVSILFWCAPGAVAGLFTHDPAVHALAKQAIWFAGFILACDAMMGIVMGALRGTGDVWVPTGLQVAAFWLGAVPVSWGLAIGLGLGPVGLIAGVGSGIAASLVMMVLRWLQIAQRLERTLVPVTT